MKASVRVFIKMHSHFTVPICQKKKYRKYTRLHAGCNENIGFGSLNNTALYQINGDDW